MNLNLPYGIYVSTNADLDVKYRVANNTARDALITNKLVKVGFVIYNESDNKRYWLKTYPTEGSLTGVEWEDINLKITTENTSGISTLVNNVLNIPNYSHPLKKWVNKTDLSGSTIISNLTIDSLGHPTDWITRNLTPTDIGAQPAGTYDNYVKWIISVGGVTGNIISGNTLVFDAGNVLNTSYSDTTKTVTIGHNDITRTDPAKTTITPGYSGTFDIVESATSDAQGHLTAIQQRTIQLPDAYVHPSHTAYTETLSGATVFATFNSDALGHVTSLTTRTLTLADLGAQAAGNYELIANKNIASGYAGLDSNGLIFTSQLPPLAISQPYVVASETAQLALTVQEGDVAIRTDLKTSYIALNSSNASMSDWQQLLTPTDNYVSGASWNTSTGVLTINRNALSDITVPIDGRYIVANAAITGATHTKITYDANGLVTAGADSTTSDIPEGTNLYYTDARVAANSAVAANTAKVTESTTVTAPLVLSGYNISLPKATGSVNGYLSSADWTTFNNKLSSYTETDPVFKASTVYNISNGTGFLKNNGTGTWSYDNSTYLTGNQTISITGDATGSGATSIALTLAASGVTAGTYNNVTVNAKGLVTGASNVSYEPAFTKNTAFNKDFGTATGQVWGYDAHPTTTSDYGLPTYPTTLPASDVYAWAKAATKPSYTTDEVTEGSTNLYYTDARVAAKVTQSYVNGLGINAATLGGISLANFVYGTNGQANTSVADVNTIPKAGFYVGYNTANSFTTGDFGIINIPTWKDSSSSSQYSLQIGAPIGTTASIRFRNIVNNTAGTWYTLYGNNNANSTGVDWSAQNITLAGSITGATSITTGTITPTNLTTGYIPYMNGSLVNSPVYTDGVNVGIGTILKANTYPSTFTTLSIKTQTGDYCPIIELVGTRSATNGNQNGIIQFFNATTTPVWVNTIASIQGTSPDSGQLKFDVANTGTLSEAARIDQYGNVFIGYTSDPTSGNKLAVNGNGYFAGNITATGEVTVGPHTDGTTEVASNVLYGTTDPPSGTFKEGTIYIKY